MATEEEMQQLMNELEAADEKIKELQAENRALQMREVGMGDEDDMSEQLEALRSQNETITDDLNRAKEKIHKLEKDARMVEENLREERENAKRSDREMTAAVRKMEELKRLYVKEKEANAKRGASTQAMEAQYEEMKTECKEAMEKNLYLQGLIDDMKTQMEQVEEHVNEKDIALENLESEIAREKEVAAKLEDAIKQKTDDFEHKSKDLEEALKIIQDREEALVVAEKKAQTEAKRHQDEIADVRTRLKAEIAKSSELSSTIVSLRDTSETGSLVKEVELLKKQLKEATDSESALHAKFDGVTRDYLELADKHVALDQNFQSLVDEAVEKSVVKERQRIESLQLALKDKEETIKELELRAEKDATEKVALEEEMMGVKEYMQSNKELGFDALHRDVTLLKAALRDADTKTEKMVERQNVLRENLTRITEANKRLKKKCGLPEDFAFDKLELDESVRREIESSKYLLHELKEQNRDLENERIRLLKKLMRQAELHNVDRGSGRFAKLSASEQDLVMQYVENLRRGVEEKPLDDKSWKLKRELDEAQNNIRQLRTANTEVQMRLERALREGGSKDVHTATKFGSDESAERVVTSDIMNEMREEMASIKKGEAALRESLISNLPAIVRESTEAAVRRANSERQDGIVSRDDVRDVRVEDLQNALRSARDECAKLRRRVEDLESGDVPAEDAETRKRKSRPPLHPRGASMDSATDTDADDRGILATDFSASRAMEFSKDRSNEDSDSVVVVSGVEDGTASIMSRQSDSSRTITVADTPNRKLSFSTTSTADAGRPSEDDVEITKAEDKYGEEEDRSLSSGIEADDAAAAEELLRQMEEPLNLLSKDNEQPTWARELRKVHRQLMASIVLLARRDRALDESAESSESALARVRDALHRRSALYHQYAADMQVHRGTIKSQQEALDTMRVELDAAQIKARRFDELVATVTDEENNENASASRRKLERKLSKELVTLELKHAVLQRQLRLARANESAASDAAERAEARFVDAQVTYKRRILYLELWKRRSSHSMKSLVKAMARVAPRSELDVAREELRAVKAHYAESVEREAHLRSTIAQLSSSLENAVGLEARIAEIESQQRTSDDNDNDDKIGKPRADETRRIILRLREDVARLSSALEAAEQRVSEVSAKQKSVSNKTRDELNEARAAVAKMEKRCSELSAELNDSALEIEKQKRLASIAATQAQTMQQASKIVRESQDELRNLLHEKWSKTDDDMIIGKLQQELLSTKVSYQKFARNHRATLASLQQKELEIRRLHEENDRKDRLVLGLEARHARESATLRAALDSIAELGCSDEDRGHDTIKTLRDSLEELSKALDERSKKLSAAEEGRRVAESKLAESKLHADAARSAQADIRALLSASTSDASKDGQHRHQLRMAAKRLESLNNDLRDARLRTLKVERDMGQLRDRNAFMTRQIARNQEHIDGLQRTVETKDAELRQLRLNKEVLVAPASRATKDALEFDSESAAINDGSDRSLDDRAEKDSARIRELMKENARLGATLRDNERTMSMLKEDAVEADTRVRVLERQIEAEGLVPVRATSKNETNGDVRENSDENETGSTTRRRERYFENDCKRVQLAAKQTIASLQAVLANKNRTVERYRQKLKDVQEMQQIDAARMQEEIERLTERLYEDNRHTIDKLRQAVTDARHRPEISDRAAVEEDMNADLMRRLDEAHAIAKEHRDAEREMRLKLREEKHLRDKLERQLVEQSDEIDDLEKQLDNERASAKRERQSQAELRAPLERATVTLKQSVTEQKSESERLKDALRKLKDRLVAAEEKHAEDMETQKIQLNRDREESERAARRDLKKLQKRLEKLQSSGDAEENSARDIDDDDVDDDNDDDVASKRKSKHAANSSATRTPQRSAASRQLLQRKIDRQREMLKRRTGLAKKLRKDLERSRSKLEASLQRESKLRKAIESLSSSKRASRDVNSGSPTTHNDEHSGRKVEEVGDDDDDEKQNSFDLSFSETQKRRSGGDDDDDDDEKNASRTVVSLRKRIKVLTAQNAALRGAALEAANHAGVRPATSIVRTATSAAAEIAARRAMGGSGISDGRRMSVGAWQANKKLKRRVDTLQRRLKDRTKELEDLRVARSGAGSERDRERARHAAEVRAMRSRLEELQSANQELSDALSDKSEGNALKELTRRNHIVESELLRQREESAKMKLEKTVLQRTLESVQKRAEIAEAAVETDRRRRRQIEDERGDAYERANIESESTFLREEQLVDALSEARKEVASAQKTEATLRRENLELKFALENAQLESRRCEQRIEDTKKTLRMQRLRVSDIETTKSDAVALDQMSSSRRRGGTHSKNGSDLRERVAESQNRAKALEAVIDRMKRALKKQQIELKRKSDALERHESTRRECERLRKKLARVNGASPTDAKSSARHGAGKSGDNDDKLSRRRSAEALAVQTRLRQKVKRSDQRWRASQSENDSLRKEVRRYENELADLRRQMSKATNPSGAAQTRIEALERRDTILERKLSTANQELVTLRVAAANAERIASENAFLKKELSAFDSEFFEEIEDLKYNYAMALEEIKRLKSAK